MFDFPRNRAGRPEWVYQTRAGGFRSSFVLVLRDGIKQKFIRPVQAVK